MSSSSPSFVLKLPKTSPLLRIAVFHRIFAFSSDVLSDALIFGSATSTWKEALEFYCEDFWKRVIKKNNNSKFSKTKTSYLDQQGVPSKGNGVLLTPGAYIQLIARQNLAWVARALHRQGGLGPGKPVLNGERDGVTFPLIIAIIQRNDEFLKFLLDRFYSRSSETALAKMAGENISDDEKTLKEYKLDVAESLARATSVANSLSYTRAIQILREFTFFEERERENSDDSKQQSSSLREQRRELEQTAVNALKESFLKAVAASDVLGVMKILSRVITNNNDDPAVGRSGLFLAKTSPQSGSIPVLWIAVSNSLEVSRGHSAVAFFEKRETKQMMNNSSVSRESTNIFLSPRLSLEEENSDVDLLNNDEFDVRRGILSLLLQNASRDVLTLAMDSEFMVKSRNGETRTTTVFREMCERQSENQVASAIFFALKACRSTSSS